MFTMPRMVRLLLFLLDLAVISDAEMFMDLNEEVETIIDRNGMPLSTSIKVVIRKRRRRNN